jgi:hypothetical protein
MKTYGRVEVQLHSFLTSAVDGGERLTSHAGRVTPPPKKKMQHPLNRQLGWPQSRSEAFAKEKNLLP